MGGATGGTGAAGAAGGELGLRHQHRRMSADTSWCHSLLAKVVVSASNADGAEIVDDELLNKAALQTKIDSHSASLSSMVRTATSTSVSTHFTRTISALPPFTRRVVCSIWE